MVELRIKTVDRIVFSNGKYIPSGTILGAALKSGFYTVNIAGVAWDMPAYHAIVFTNGKVRIRLLCDISLEDRSIIRTGQEFDATTNYSGPSGNSYVVLHGGPVDLRPHEVEVISVG